jgi:hypothetical protein
MQVPRFSPRISLIEMAPRAAPHSGCPGRPALPLPCLSPAPQGRGSDWKNLPGTAQFLSTQTEPVPPPARSFPARAPPPARAGPPPPPGHSPPVLAPSPPGRPSGPPPARSFPARPPLPRPGWPPAPCFTGLSLPPPPKTLHRERAVTGRIFQALPTRTDRRTDIVTLIYKIVRWWELTNMSLE